MADYSVTSPAEAFAFQFDRMAAQIRVASPGVITSFDPATQTAGVQPSIKMKVNLGDGVRHVDLPLIQNVPVVLPFAQGAGVLLTLPIQAGDECLLVFADRAIDNFVQAGGLQPTIPTASDDTTTPRSHSLSDAICIPGIISNPQAVPEYNNEHIELRDRERKHYISLGPDGIVITDGTASLTLREGKVVLTTPETVCIQSGNMTLGGDGGTVNELEHSLKSRQGTFIDKDGVVLNSHLHRGVSQGDQHTGEPEK